MKDPKIINNIKDQSNCLVNSHFITYRDNWYYKKAFLIGLGEYYISQDKLNCSWKSSFNKNIRIYHRGSTSVTLLLSNKFEVYRT